MADDPIINLSQIDNLKDFYDVLNATSNAGLEKAASVSYISRTFTLKGAIPINAKMEELVKKFKEIVDNTETSAEVATMVADCHDILAEMDAVGDAKLNEKGSLFLRNLVHFRWTSHRKALDQIENERVFNEAHITTFPSLNTITYSDKADEIINASKRTNINPKMVDVSNTVSLSNDKDDLKEGKIDAFIRFHFIKSSAFGMKPLEEAKQRNLLRCVAAKDPEFAKDILLQLKKDYPEIMQKPELRNFINSLMLVTVTKNYYDVAVGRILNKEKNELYAHIHGSHADELYQEIKAVSKNLDPNSKEFVLTIINKFINKEISLADLVQKIKNSNIESKQTIIHTLNKIVFKQVNDKINELFGPFDVPKEGENVKYNSKIAFKFNEEEKEDRLDKLNDFMRNNPFSSIGFDDIDEKSQALPEGQTDEMIRLIGNELGYNIGINLDSNKKFASNYLSDYLEAKKFDKAVENFPPLKNIDDSTEVKKSLNNYYREFLYLEQYSNRTENLESFINKIESEFDHKVVTEIKKYLEKTYSNSYPPNYPKKVNEYISKNYGDFKLLENSGVYQIQFHFKPEKDKNAIRVEIEKDFANSSIMEDIGDQLIQQKNESDDTLTLNADQSQRFLEIIKEHLNIQKPLNDLLDEMYKIKQFSTLIDNKINELKNYEDLKSINFDKDKEILLDFYYKAIHNNSIPQESLEAEFNSLPLNNYLKGFAKKLIFNQ